MATLTPADVALLLDVLPEVVARLTQAGAWPGEDLNPHSPEGRTRRDRRDTAAALRDLQARLRAGTHTTQEHTMPEPTYHLILTREEREELLHLLKHFARGASALAEQIGTASPDSPMGEAARLARNDTERLLVMAARVESVSPRGGAPARSMGLVDRDAFVAAVVSALADIPGMADVCRNDEVPDTVRFAFDGAVADLMLFPEDRYEWTPAREPAE